MTGIDRAMLRQSWRSWAAYERPRRGPYALQLLWTFLFGAVLALIFTVIGYLFGQHAAEPATVARLALFYGKNLVVASLIAFAVHGLFEVAMVLVSPQRVRAWAPWRQTLFFSGIPTLGVLLAWPLGVELMGGNLRQWLDRAGGAQYLAGSLIFAVLITFLLHHWFAARTRQLDAERRATEAQLRLLQAQIEPHFLFNTLANVQSLIEADPPAARRMLEAFIDYLRGSLQQLRRDAGSTLAEEVELARTYLMLMAMRMGDRLRFTISLDDAPPDFPMPPLLLQPLVENAVRHGLEDKVDGGTVHIAAARTAGGGLRIEVRDDGLGAEAPRRPRPGGNGLALANIRERLAARYEGRAALTLSNLTPGTCAMLELPAP